MVLLVEHALEAWNKAFDCQLHSGCWPQGYCVRGGLFAFSDMQCLSQREAGTRESPGTCSMSQIFRSVHLSWAAKGWHWGWWWHWKTTLDFMLIHGHIPSCKSLTGRMWKLNATITFKLPKIIIPWSCGEYFVIQCYLTVILQNHEAKDRLHFSGWLFKNRISE